MPEHPDIEFVESGFSIEDPNEFLPFLQELDERPGIIEEFFQGRRIRRLGKYFEQILFCFLHLHPSFELILSNYQVRQGKQSIGEIDLVYKDLRKGEVVHLELAVKFYLGVGDTENWINWFGPNTIDRLDLKMNKMLNKQARLASHPALVPFWEDLGFKPSVKRIMLKGFLFYPQTESYPIPRFSSPAHNKSTWITAGNFSYRDKVQYKVLPRLRWLSKNQADVSELEDFVPKRDVTKPTLIAEFGSDGLERKRYFLVPKFWENQARHILSNQ